MLIRELLFPKSQGAKAHYANSRAGAALCAEASRIEREAAFCATLIRQLAHDQAVGRHISEPNSAPKSVGRVKEDGVPKNAKPPAVAKPRKLKTRNAIKPKTSVSPPKPLKPVGA